jgi:hypothetical protein
MAISATAHAGSTITDKSYWPNEARQSVQTRTFGSPSEVNSAFAYYPAVPRFQPSTNTYDGGSAWRYHGGPKNR